jgi:glycosyltransferase involved in cell wall biosynthesis
MAQNSKWLCCQLGAREHYAVPRALHRVGRLNMLYTDMWSGRGVQAAARLSGIGPLRALASRFHPELAGAPVESSNLRGVAWRVAARRASRSDGASGRYLGYMELGRQFACTVRDSLRRRRLLPCESLLFAYDTGALELLQWLRSKDIRGVVGQMDPNRVEAALVQEEERRWPGWQAEETAVPESYFRRRELEWAFADRVVVNSEFCRRALVEQGVPPQKLVVIPLCYEPARATGHSRLRTELKPDGARPSFSMKEGRRLRVLWLGQVILRKGIQYLMEAARLLENEPIQFEVVGPIGISRLAVASAPSNVAFHGRATRDQAAAWYGQCDLFVLPTLSDGFAITQLEAMAHGLPVIATPYCGEVVSEEIDGFIVPARNSDALAHAVRRYISEANLLQAHQDAALRKSRQFTIGRLTEALLSLEADLLGRKREPALEPESR